MKILVVDDEELAIDNLVSLIKDYKTWEDDDNKRQDSLTILTSNEPTEAVDTFFTEQPDLVFLDINMPGISGMELGKIFCEKAHIVFVTAYSEFAVEAFNLSAIDYLLKPLDDQRFAQAMEKVKRTLQLTTPAPSTDPAYINNLKAVLDMLTSQHQSGVANVIVIKEVGKIRRVETSDILYVMGSGNYVEIYLHNGQMVLHRETMSNMARKLSEQEFLRIHRSSIVRISSISELLSNGQSDYNIKLKNGIELPVARHSKHHVLALFT